MLQMLQITRLDTAWAVSKGPQILQAAFAAAADVFVYRLAWLQFDETVAK